MGNKKGIRVLALVMAVVCTLTVVSAAELLFDKNGDGKTTVWDLQNVFTNDKSNYDKALSEVLGGKGDELSPNKDGIYEIWSEMGLQNMVKNATKGYTFELMADIDLGGKDWTPVNDFKGVFNGNDKTISNFKITKATSDGDMGFFADTKNADDASPEGRTKISDLHLTGVELIVDAVDDATETNSAAKYIGAVVGTNRGDLANCTAVSVVTDKRADVTKTVYYGSLVGRNATRRVDDKETTNGMISGANELATTVNITKASKDFKNPGTKVNSKMAVFFSDKLDYETKAAKKFIGVAGVTRTDAIDHALRWQDLTNSTDLADPVLQTRRETAAAEMYKMCTEEWTPYYTMYYYKFDKKNADGTPKKYSYTTIYKDTVYKGIPYTHGSSGYDRFMAYKGDYEDGTATNANAYYFNSTTYNTGLNAAYEAYVKDNNAVDTATGQKWVDIYPELRMMSAKIGSNHQVGWSKLIGTDCSSQAAWAWRKISAVTGTGFANVQGTADMFPMYGTTDSDGKVINNNIDTYGIKAVNKLEFDYPGDADFDGDKNDSGDKCAYLSEYLVNNKTYWMESLAQTSKGDALMEYSPAGGHTRVAISDAVVVYSYDGSRTNSRSSLDSNLSYVVTAEQGGSGEDSDGINHYHEYKYPALGELGGYKWRSTCCVDRRETFYDMTEGAYSEDYTNKKDDQGNYVYYNKDAEGANPNYKAYLCWFPITCDALRNPNSDAGTVQVSMPNGKVTSNFHIVSYTVNGETTYTGIAQSGHRAPITSVTVTANAGETVVVRLANGKDYTFTR